MGRKSPQNLAKTASTPAAGAAFRRFPNLSTPAPRKHQYETAI
jgi:hypothetical protein